MNEKRFTMDYEPTYREIMYLDNNDIMTDKEVLNKLNNLADENKQLKQMINSRLDFYNELYDSTKNIIAKRVVEDLEDILKR